ncbi:MAG: DUF4271 domain-containing protein [Bacteroidota bacterium]
MKIKEAHILAEDWTIFVLLFSLSLLAYIRFKRPLKLQRLGDAIQNTRMVKQIMRDDNLIGNRFSFFMALNFCLMLALSIYFALKVFADGFFEQYNFHLFWIIAIGIFAIYFIKSLLLSIADNLFNKDYGFEEYLRNVFIFNGALGLLLLPLNFLLAFLHIQFAQWMLILIFAFVLLCLTFRLYRGLLIGNENHSQSQYLFLYLCTLEILPTAVIIKKAVTIII